MATIYEEVPEENLLSMGDPDVSDTCFVQVSVEALQRTRDAATECWANFGRMDARMTYAFNTMKTLQGGLKGVKWDLNKSLTRMKLIDMQNLEDTEQHAFKETMQQLKREASKAKKTSRPKADPNRKANERVASYRSEAKANGIAAAKLGERDPFMVKGKARATRSGTTLFPGVVPKSSGSAAAFPKSSGSAALVDDSSAIGVPDEKGDSELDQDERPKKKSRYHGQCVRSTVLANDVVT